MTFKKQAAHVRSKQGVSAVMATVLTILLTVAAATVLWSGIAPYFSDRIERSWSCLDASRTIQIVAKGVCADSAALRVQIRRAAFTGELADIQVIVRGTGQQTSLFLVADDVVLPRELPGPNEQRSIRIPSWQLGGLDISDVQAVRIAARLQVRGEQQACDSSPEVAVVACS